MISCSLVIIIIAIFIIIDGLHTFSGLRLQAFFSQWWAALWWLECEEDRHIGVLLY